MSKKVFISKSLSIGSAGRKGRGVFALKPFKKGEVIEISPYILVPPKDDTKLSETILNSYWFLVKGKWSAIGLGYTSIYNHNEKPNATFSVNKRRRVITIKATQPIRVGQEICTNYGYSLED